MNSAPILKGKHAVVFGAGGSIGTAVANKFAVEGAEVFLSSRTKPSVDAVANQIAANGGLAHTAAIDTLDDAAVNQYIDGIVKQTGKIDIVLDAAGPLARVWKRKECRGVADCGAHGAADDDGKVALYHLPSPPPRHMIEQHSDVIIFVTGSPARGHVPGATAIGAA